MKLKDATTDGYTTEDLRIIPWDDFLKATGAVPKEIVVKTRDTRYICLDVAYWDPEKKMGLHRRRTIGRYDAEGRRIMNGSEDDTSSRIRPRKKPYAVTEEVGCALLLDTVSARTGLGSVVTEVFGKKDADAIMTCAYYMARSDGALCGCEQWSAGSATPFGERLGDQRISELLPRLTADRQKEFFNLWRDKMGDDDNYAIDITSISSYIETISIIRAGYNRDGEKLEQINMALMVGSKSLLPVCYRIIPGNVNDKSALVPFIKTLDAMGFKRYKLVLDKGFYSEANVNEMYRLKVKFTLSVPNSKKFAADAIEAARPSIGNFDNYLSYGTSKVYASTTRESWTTDGKNHRCYVHVFFDPRKKSDDDNHFDEDLNSVRSRILVDGDEAAVASSMARKYLIVSKRNGKYTVKSNQAAIDEHKRNSSGFLVILSNHVKTADEALRIYRAKETAECGFDDMKCDIDLDRLRIHSEEALNGKIFIAFLALILKFDILRTIRDEQELRYHSRDEVMREMAILRRTSIGGADPVYTELTKLQKTVIACFGITDGYS